MHNVRRWAILIYFSLALFSLSHISANSANTLLAAEPEVGIHQCEVVTFNGIEAILIRDQAIDIMRDNANPEVKVGSHDDRGCRVRPPCHLNLACGNGRMADTLLSAGELILQYQRSVACRGRLRSEEH